jgi:hypothetical protein
MEIVGFLAKHPEFRPAPLDQLAGAYYQAWRWIRNDYNDKNHAFSIFAFGRGNFSYITREREWQQTVSILGKAALAQQRFMEGLVREKILTFPSEIARRDLNRFVFFRHGGRPAGVWLVRQGSFYFTLPITTGPKPGVADYLPAPHGLKGFANPVEQVYPSLVPFIELEDGRVWSPAIAPTKLSRLRMVKVFAQDGSAGPSLAASPVNWRMPGSPPKSPGGSRE